MACIARIILLFSIGFSPTIFALQCGYPGSPLHGRPDTVQELYSEGQVVSYACDAGYFMMGPATRICMPNGTWTGRIPLCDTSLNPSGIAEISQSLTRYSAMLAIDRKPDTCTFTTAHSPRWWRLDMGQSYRVLSVGITMPSANVEQRFSIYILGLSGNSAIYQRCASFNGKLASSLVFLACSDGSGITGRYIHIEDHRKEPIYFGLCEIDVMVFKDHYDCGLPDRPARSYTMRLKPEQVDYKCISGYKLVGPKQRQCLTNGQWSHTQPLCIEVNCQSLGHFANGRIRITPQREGRSLLGSTATYVCEDGHLLQGNATRICSENGQWSGLEPSCKPVDCGEVPHKWYVLLNDSSGFDSLAELTCQAGYQLIGESPIIRCRGDASWSRAKAKCILPAISVKQSASKEAEDRRQDNPSLSIGLIIGIIGALLVIAFVIIFILFKRRRKKADSCSPRDETLSSSGAGSCQSLMTNSYHDNCFIRRPKSSNGISEHSDDYQKTSTSRVVSAPTFTFSVIPMALHSPHSSVSSRENIYEEITVGNHRRKTRNPAAFRQSSTASEYAEPATSGDPDQTAALYAQVDFQKKRESRLLRDDPTTPEQEVTPPGTPVVLRELPPIPGEDDQPTSPSSTITTLSSATVVVENDIYEATPHVEQLKMDNSVVMDNDLYSSS